MKLAWILWMAGNVLPQPAADSLCLSTTVYLEARDQSVRGQQAVAEVALRRRDSGLWGRNLCQVVTARKQFAPTIVSPQTRLSNSAAWAEAVTIALESERNWALPKGQRRTSCPVPATSWRMPSPRQPGAMPIRSPRSATTPSCRCRSSSHAARAADDIKGHSAQRFVAPALLDHASPQADSVGPRSDRGST